MPRRALLIAACIALAGCESYGDLTSDAFEPGNATQARFILDSADCQARAENSRSYDVRGITATHAERHEIFNAAYADCMKAAGYPRRDWSPEIPDPFAIDPTPG